MRPRLSNLTLVSLFIWIVLGTVAVAQESPLDRPFPQPMYLLHITETSTTSGPRTRDDYILYPQQPQDGILITPDGMGGTFNNRAETIAGPFYTLGQVCSYVRSWGSRAQALGCPAEPPPITPTIESPEPTSELSATAEPSRSPSSRTSLSEWWDGLSGAGKAITIGGAVLIALWLLGRLGEPKPPPTQEASIRRSCAQPCSISGCTRSCIREADGHTSGHNCGGSHVSCSASCPRTRCHRPCSYSGTIHDPPHRCPDHGTF
jgi:hypothetical protein